MKNHVFYNSEIKNRFIDESDYSSNTKITISQMFDVTCETEEFYNKDIYEMSDSEIAEVLDNFDATSYETIYSRTSYLASYVDWCIKEGYLKTNINNVRLHFGSENIKTYVKKPALKYKILTKENFDHLIEFCINDQDKAMFLLLYNGARGRQIQENSLEELRNLKWDDINEENNTITLKRNDENKIIAERTIEVEPYVIKVLRDAYNQEKFIKNNGELTEWSKKKSNTHLKLLNTEYVLAPTIIGGYGRIPAQVISQRIRVIRKFYKNPFITIANIWYSGMVEYGKKIKQKTGRELIGDDYREICIRFGHDTVYYSKIKSRIEKYI
jgi:integrase